VFLLIPLNPSSSALSLFSPNRKGKARKTKHFLLLSVPTTLLA
jgi:hypothetical protein